MTTQRTEMRAIVLFANLLFSFLSAITLYTNSSYIESTMGITVVGILYAASALASILILARAGKVLGRIGNRRYFFSFGALYALSLAAIILPSGPIVQSIAFFTYLLSTNVLLFSMNIFFEHLFPKKIVGKMRGTFLLLGNLGILMGPVVAAQAIDMAGYTGMYALSLGLFSILAIVMYFGLKRYSDAEYNFGRVTLALKHTIEKRSLRNVITANFILQFFYAWMIVYTPIYLFQKLGFSWDAIGVLFFAMLLTFVVLDYPLGKIADYLGSEKELAVVGFFIMTLSVFALALTRTPDFATVAVILVCSRIGAAIVEAMTEIHFFKIAKDSDPGLLALFSDLRPLAYVLAPLLGAIAVALLPFHLIFFVLGLILIVGFVSAFYLEDTTGWWVRAHKN